MGKVIISSLGERGRMDASKVVVGVFTYLDDILSAIDKIKSAGQTFKVYSPTFVSELDQAIDQQRSKVAIVTLTGGILGCTGGFSLAILCGLDWPLRVSAKEIVAIPGYFVIGYEGTILLGALATLLGIFALCRLPNIIRKVGYDPRFSCDKFGLVVDCSSEQLEDVKAILKGAGADEVNEQDGL